MKVCVLRTSSLCLVTVFCHRPTPPNADIRYMMTIAICTSVTSILQRWRTFTGGVECLFFFFNLAGREVQLTGRSAWSRRHRSATGRRRTWTSPQNRRRTSNPGTGQFRRKCRFPRQQRLTAEKRDRCWEMSWLFTSKAMGDFCRVRAPVETASQPWSKISPRGEELLVRLDCFPSMASRDW